MDEQNLKGLEAEEKKKQYAIETIRDRLLKSVKETAEKNKYYFFKENNYGQ